MKHLGDMMTMIKIICLLCIVLCIPVVSQATVSLGSSAGTVSAGSILMTLNGTCPADYTENTNFRGRAAVGTPSGGTVAGTLGIVMTNLEARLPAIATTGGSIATTSTSVGVAACSVCSVWNNATSTTLSTTNNQPSLPYIQVLFCTKS